jgi:hypothetical protein
MQEPNSVPDQRIEISLLFLLVHRNYLKSFVIIRAQASSHLNMDQSRRPKSWRFGFDRTARSLIAEQSKLHKVSRYRTER